MANSTIHDQIANLLTLPRFTQIELLNFTSPKIDSSVFANWLRRGFLNLELQAALATGPELKEIASELEGNSNLELDSPYRRFSGGDFLKVQTLNIMSQIGLPLSLSPRIITAILNRAVQVMVEPSKAEMAIHLFLDADTEKYKLCLGLVELMPDQSHEWEGVIHADRMIARFLKTVGAKPPAQTEGIMYN